MCSTGTSGKKSNRVPEPYSRGMVYFAHGQESGPWGTKIKSLAKIATNQGFAVESPDYSGIMNPDQRVSKLLELNPKSSGKLILAGSSMGAWVSLKASGIIFPDGLFLLAPAVYIGEYSEEAPVPKARACCIIHGWNDDVVPVNQVIEFSWEHGLELHLMDSDHRLTDQLPMLENLFAHFLENV